MKLTIFARLVIGYVIVLLLVVAVGVYTMTKLRQLNRISHGILTTDYPTLNLGRRLADSLLSQVRNEKKYLILKDEVFYNEFSKAKNEFEEVLGRIETLVDSSQEKELLVESKRLHNRYLSLLYEEIGLMNSGRSFSEHRYKEERERLVNQITLKLEKLATINHTTINRKMQKSEQIGSTAVKVTVIIILLVIFVGMAISLSIAQNVNQPLSQLRQKTKEIAHGNFGESLSISSPAEIGELAKAFNLMCNKLKELDEMKSDFLSRISHELRTPLTSIKEADSLLLDGIGGNITHKQRRLLTIIKEECDKLINSINALLSLSRIQAGMMTYNFEPSSLASVINQSVTEIEPLIGHKRIQLNTEITKDLPHVRIDKEAVLQVLRNLLGNALKFTPEGGAIKLSAETIPKGSSTLRLVRGRIDKGVIMVSIADSGPGIPKENLAQIFDRFYQVKMQSPHTEGTGLGLSIAKHIVSAHRGKIWVESEPGKGSALTFTLPA